MSSLLDLCCVIFAPFSGRNGGLIQPPAQHECCIEECPYDPRYPKMQVNSLRTIPAVRGDSALPLVLLARPDPESPQSPSGASSWVISSSVRPDHRQPKSSHISLRAWPRSRQQSSSRTVRPSSSTARVLRRPVKRSKATGWLGDAAGQNRRRLPAKCHLIRT